MFAKLVVVVLALGACGCALLAMRQSRLQLASELTQTQLRINAADERLWALRAQIAARVTPEQIEEMAAGVAPLHQMTDPSRMRVPASWLTESETRNRRGTRFGPAPHRGSAGSGTTPPRLSNVEPQR